MHKASQLSVANDNGMTSGALATTTCQYDAQGNCTSVTDPNGNTRRMGYDGLGEMLSRKQGDGSEENFTYEPGGKIATHQTLLKGNESYSYTAGGLLKSITHADGTTTSCTYDLGGRLIQETLSNGSHWNISYDGNTITRIFSDAAGNSLGSTSETYDGRGNLLQKTDLAGNQWSYSYDGLNRVKTEQGPPAAGNSAAQSAIHSYGLNAISTVNGIGEKTYQIFDALGRLIQRSIFNKDGTIAQNVHKEYSGDHQSVVTTIGTGDNAITTTTYTDTLGHPVMIKQADGPVSKMNYDANGNEISVTNEEGNVTSYTYDALDHLVSEVRSDGTVIKYSCNAAGELLTRSMPQGITEQNNYNESGQKVDSLLVGSDGAITRHYSYNYVQGLLASISDPRGFQTSITYDAWMHPASLSSSGSSIPEQNQTTTYSYDLRGLLTSVAQKYNDPSTGPSTLVSRAYDAYGQLVSEITALNGTNIAAWSQAWDGAGRRTALNWNLDNNGKGAQYAFSYNALGLMTRSQNAAGACSYAYGDQGLLLSKTTPAGSENFQRDQQGRLIHQMLPDGSEESLSLRSDGKISSYAISGNSQNETRNYDYDPLGRLTQEPYTLMESVDPNVLSVGTHLATYTFDQLGVRLKQEVTPDIKNIVSAKNDFSQVGIDDLNDGVNKTYSWNSSYDAAGAVTARGIDGAIIQDLTWDSLGRLVTVAQRNNNDQGYNWKTTYDGLGRRLQTSYCDATGNQMTSGALTINYYYDPEVEFLELGRDYFGRTWNLYGPDRSGLYGGAQGVGGLEATTAEGHDEVHGIVNNVFGDIMGITTNGVFNPWGNILGGYGAMLGSSVNTDLVPQWRSHYLDWTGFYYMGTRYYEPKSGRFLSPDPLGHDASLSLYDYCDGDPVNGLDPDGRCVEQCEQQAIALNNTRYQNTTLMNNVINTRSDIPTTLQGIGGELLSYLDGDLDDLSFSEAQNQALQRVPNPEQVMSVNGILTSVYKARANANDIAASLHVDSKATLLINNYTHGVMDIPRLLVEQCGAIDLRSMCLATIVNHNNGGKLFAYSNGSVVVGNARPYMNKSAAANVDYIGLNPQWYLDQQEYGFKKADNARNLLDVISVLSPGNWFRKWQKIIKTNTYFFEILKNKNTI